MIATAAVLSLFGASPTIEAPPEVAQQVETAVESPFLSEAPRAGFRADLFDRATKPKANLVGLFSTEDYPLQSIANAEEGTVAVLLRIDPAGHLADCVVDQSSGSTSLDLQTCRIFWLRARFDPARDKSGRAVESAVRQRIRWVLPEAEPVPVTAWSSRVSIDYIKDGGVVACRIETTGALKADDSDCGFFRSLSGGMLARIRSDAGYGRQTFVMETQFSPGPAVPVVKPPVGTELFMRQVSRLTIDSSGKPLRCEVISTEGPQPPIEGCPDLLDGRYEKPGLGVGAIEAIVARSLFLTR